MRLLITLLMAALVALTGLAAAAPAGALQATGQPARTAEQPARATEVAPPRTAVQRTSVQYPYQIRHGRLPTDLQRAIETGNTDLVLAYVQAARPGQTPAGALDVSAGGPQGFICNGGNCACAGAFDCLNMFDVDACVAGTIGCNDYGCTCQGKDGAEGSQN